MFDLMIALKHAAQAVSGTLQQAYSLVGPVAPVLLGIALLEGVLLLFLLALVLSVSQRQIRAERDFMLHLRKGNDAFSNVAIVVGFIGTYLGIMDVLPVLAKIVEGKAASGTTADLLGGLSSAFVSSMAGLALGGVLGSINGYLLDVAVPDEQDGPREGPQDGSLDQPVSAGENEHASHSQNGHGSSDSAEEVEIYVPA